MKTVVASLVATVSLLVLHQPSTPAPPDDVAAYCRATYSQGSVQARCIDIENASAQRVARAGAGADRDAFDRCLGASPSWAAMESCLVQSGRGVPTGGIPGVPGSPPAVAADTPRPGTAAVPAGGTPAGSVAGPGAAPAAEATATPPSSTVVLGPQPGLSAAAGVENRTARPISEADADRHLRGILERTGTSAARCTKKQYGPGWVIICE